MKMKIFKELVLNSFGFLITDFKLKVTAVELQPPEVWVTFQNATTLVTVTYEIGDCPWVGLKKLEIIKGKPISTWSSSLEKVLKERAPEEDLYLEPILSFDDPQVATVLRAKGRQLRKYGEDILRGDFSAFGRLK
jgi:hypothetical protein